MSKDKNYYRALVLDIAKEHPDLNWEQLLGYIKETIEDDIESNKRER